jgi:hypothetical protein
MFWQSLLYGTVVLGELGVCAVAGWPKDGLFGSGWKEWMVVVIY